MLQSPLFTTVAGSALWVPEVPGLMLRLQGDVSLAQYQLLLNHGLQMYRARAHPATPAHWIADLRQLSSLAPDAQQWMAADWNPRAHAAGLRHLRFVEASASKQPLAHQLRTTCLELETETALWLSHHETLEAAIQQARQAASATAPG